MNDSSLTTTISEQSRKFETAYCAGDAQALVTGYFVSDDEKPAAYPPGGQPPVQGRSALIAMFTGMFADAPAIRLETIDLIGSDTVAYEVGRAHLTTADGGAATGRYTVCWVLENGEWRAKVDFFAADGWSN